MTISSLHFLSRYREGPSTQTIRGMLYRGRVSKLFYWENVSSRGFSDSQLQSSRIFNMSLWTNMRPCTFMEWVFISYEYENLPVASRPPVTLISFVVSPPAKIDYDDERRAYLWNEQRFTPHKFSSVCSNFGSP